MLKSAIKSAITTTLDVIYPPRCAACGCNVPENGNICATCWGNINFISDPQCEICGFPFDFQVEGGAICGGCMKDEPYFAKARAVFIYDDASSQMVTSFKYSDRLENRVSYARWMARVGAEMLASADYLVPVPLHFRKLLSRQYNQAALLATALAKISGKKVIVNGLLRHKNTVTQASFNRRLRLQNIRGAFKVNPKFIDVFEDKNMLLIDDVLTTGATADECAKVLLKAGAARVEVLTLAKTIY